FVQPRIFRGCTNGLPGMSAARAVAAVTRTHYAADMAKAVDIVKAADISSAANIFKEVRGSSWSDDNAAMHGVSLGEVREAVLGHPYWTAPGQEGTTLVYGLTNAGRHLL